MSDLLMPPLPPDGAPPIETQDCPDEKRAWGIGIGVMVAGVVIITALGGCAPDKDKLEQVAAAAPVATTTPHEAAEAAVGETDLGFLSRSQLVGIVEATCASMTDDAPTPKVAEQVVETLEVEVENLTADQVQSAADTLATLVPRACPDGVRSHPDLINEVIALAPTTTVTTTSTTTTTTSPPTTAPPVTAPPTTAAPVAAPPPPAPSGGGTSYANCTEARAAGVTPLYRGDPGYAPKLDGDNDGIACE